jgi:diguanylate cyclase (GGDEF)-like protein
MNLTGAHLRPHFRFVENPPLSRTWAVVAVAVAFVLIFVLDLATGTAPVHHLYYLPIVFATVRLGGRLGLLTAVAAAVLYRVANTSGMAWMWHYQELDILRVGMFIAIAVITDRQTAYARHLHQLATTDDLTGLHNLRAFEARFENMLRVARERRTPVALLVLDVDRLKSLNDVHGHLAGAEAVQHVGHVLATRLPRESAACRYGGDEFVVALPQRGAMEAVGIAEDLRSAVNALAPTLAGVPFPKATLSISVGVACWTVEQRLALDRRFDPDLAGRALFRDADAALYAAKNGGRNRVGVEQSREREVQTSGTPA